MPPDGSVNRSAPANTQTFALMIISSRPARCAPLAFSASTPTKPATNPSSTGSVARFPNDASTYAHTNMMTAPTNALMLQSRMRFCVSTRWASLVPSRRIRSSSRRAGARHSASRCGRRRRGNGARRIARLILSPKWLCTSAATLWSGSCSTWLRLTINNPACRQVAPPIANSTGCVAIPRTIAVTKSRSLAPSKGGKDRGATMNGTVASKEVTERKVVDSIWWTLRMSFGLVPLLAGLDKFFNLLTQWPKYVAPAFAHALPVTPQHFMYASASSRSSPGWRCCCRRGRRCSRT